MAEKKIRERIPDSIKSELFFHNDMTCCVCREKSKRVIIHHIDENPNKNNPNNLAVLCAEDHDRMHIKGGLASSFPVTTLRYYKSSWEEECISRLLGTQPPLKSLSKIEKTLFDFEIRKKAYELCPLLDDELNEIHKITRFLLLIKRHEGYIEKILKAYLSISVEIGFTSIKKAMAIIDEMYHYIPTFKTKKTRKRELSILQSIQDIVCCIGNASVHIRRNKGVLTCVTNFFFTPWDIYLELNNEDAALKFLSKLIPIDCNCRITGCFENIFLDGVQVLVSFYTFLREITIAKRPEWKKVLEELGVRITYMQADISK